MYLLITPFSDVCISVQTYCYVSDEFNEFLPGVTNKWSTVNSFRYIMCQVVVNLRGDHLDFGNIITENVFGILALDCIIQATGKAILYSEVHGSNAVMFLISVLYTGLQISEKLHASSAPNPINERGFSMFSKTFQNFSK